MTIMCQAVNRTESTDHKDNNRNSYWLSANCIPSSLHELTLLIPEKYYYSHFTDEDMESQ